MKFILTALLLFTAGTSFADVFDGELKIDGVRRTFHFYSPDDLPEGKRYPLVIMLHGGYGTGAQMPRFTKFNTLADRDSFLVVYPDGWKKHWNDHRYGEDLQKDKKDDVKFISVLIDYLIRKHQVDSTHVFVAGISNGAMMSLYLAQELPQKIRAIAPVCGSIPENYFSSYHLPVSISIMIINGTDDPLVHYTGGPIGKSGWQRGAVAHTDSMVKKLVLLNQCAEHDSVFSFPDINLKDQCVASKFIWKCGQSEIQFIRIKGGGHTWPGGLQYLPKYQVGRVCRDFNATSEIWNFFQSQPPRQ